MERAAERLAAAFRADGWTVSRSAAEASPEPDLLCRKHALVYAVEINAFAGRARRAVARALLAEAILRAQVLARQRNARPLAILAATSLSSDITEELSDYLATFGGGTAWGFLDERGRFSLRGDGLESVKDAGAVTEGGTRAPAVRASGAAAYNPFSDLGQWMLKVLFAPRVPGTWLDAPRESMRTMSDLARAARVSPATASKFVSALEASGHFARADDGLHLMRVKALLDSWRSASHRSAEELPARFLLRTADPAGRLREILAQRGSAALSSTDRTSPGSSAAGEPGRRACLGLFSACSQLDVGVVRGAPLHVYSEDLSLQTLEELQLHPVDLSSQADVLVRRPRFPEAVFRACVHVAGVPVTDILQCWIDVSFHPSRGAEQATEIARVLGMADWNE